jgi:hypothetical protein
MKMDVRSLTELELEAVCGGVIDCTPPTKSGPDLTPVTDWRFVDLFGPHLLSWVQPAPR